MCLATCNLYNREVFQTVNNGRYIDTISCSIPQLSFIITTCSDTNIYNSETGATKLTSITQNITEIQVIYLPNTIAVPLSVTRTLWQAVGPDAMKRILIPSRDDIR